MNGRGALALAVVAVTAAAPGARATPACGLSGDIAYTPATVSFDTTVDLKPCGMVGKVGRVRMTVELERYDLVTRETTVVRGTAVRCVTRARTCTIRLKVPHAPTEAARYEGTATYDGDGGRHLVSGMQWVSTKCWSLAGTHSSCYVPV